MNPVEIWVPLVLAPLCGRANRRAERWRFRVTLWRHGLRSHGEYVSGPAWKARRRRWLREHHWRLICWCCARPGDLSWPLHHLDYSRAGAGEERDRDLRYVCTRCHERFHRWDRRLRRAGVSLRWCTYAVRWAWWPVRVLTGSELVNRTEFTRLTVDRKAFDGYMRGVVSGYGEGNRSRSSGVRDDRGAAQGAAEGRDGSGAGARERTVRHP